VKFLFDTDHLSFLQQSAGQEFERLSDRLAIHGGDVVASVVSFHEQTLGAHSLIVRAKTDAKILRGYRLYQEIQQIFSIVPLVEFDRAACDVFNSLRLQRVRLSTLDLRIASIALSKDLTLLTRNLRDFSQVPGLRIEDWTA
jgi:tRNA(fMet)-specific endonuclease VapC